MKKIIYKWHRIFSIVVAFPVMFWAASGFMHPIMTNIRPRVTTQGLVPEILDSERIRIPLQTALLRNHIDRFSHFRLVHIDTNWFYQVQAESRFSPEAGSGGNKGVPVYLSATNGQLLPAGDWLYAQYLARQFLEGQSFSRSFSSKQPGGSSGSPDIVGERGKDCCGAATDCVLNNRKGAPVKEVSLLEDFDSEYKSINRLLPVYRVSFERPDGIRVFVETTQDRFAFAMDDKRFLLDRIFTGVHTWSWLDFLGKGKLVLEFTLVSLALLTTLMGIFIFFTTNSKKAAGNQRVRVRRLHRFSSISIALFTLMFSFSGAFHVLSKWKEDPRDRVWRGPAFAADSIHFDLSRLFTLVKDPIVNVDLVSMYGHAYWQIKTRPVKGAASMTEHRKMDLMKDKAFAMPFTAYVRTDSLSLLEGGESKYADFLASAFSGYPGSAILYTIPVTRFNNEYNFTDKRLPVWKIGYASPDNERFYVETSTGRLAKNINDGSLLEGYSFSFLHKHEFMAWGGKSVKDASTMFWAAAQIVLVIIGLLLYFNRRKRRRPSG